MSENSSWPLLVLVLVILSATIATCDCRQRGGVLVRTLAGTMACVQEVGR